MTRDTETPLRVLDHSGEDLYVLPYAWEPKPHGRLRPFYLGRPEFEWQFTHIQTFFIHDAKCDDRWWLIRDWWAGAVVSRLVWLSRWISHIVRHRLSRWAVRSFGCFRPDVLWASECFCLPGRRPDESHISIQGQLQLWVADWPTAGPLKDVKYDARCDYTETCYLEPSEDYFHRRLLELAEALDNPEVDRLMAEMPDQALRFMPKRWLEVYLGWRERQLALGREVSFAYSLDT